MSPARMTAAGALLVALVLALSIGGSYLLSLHIISQRDQVWCPILRDISGQRVPPNATAEQRRGYAEIVQVRRQFGC